MHPIASRTLRDLKHNVLAGIVTAGPLFITWLVFSFVVGVLANVGRPFVRVLTSPFPNTVLVFPWVQYTLAVLLTITAFYIVGRATSKVVGRQLFDLFETMLEHLPLVNKI